MLYQEGGLSCRVEDLPYLLLKIFTAVPTDHIFKHQFETQGRICTLYREKHQWCPFDRRTEILPSELESECFYSCRIFKAKPGEEEPVPTQEQAIVLCERAIELAKMRIAEAVRADSRDELALPPSPSPLSSLY